MNFQDTQLMEHLTGAPADMIHHAPFGVVTMTKAGFVEAYNEMEARMAGLSPDKVLGRHFFTAVAPCTNNYMVAQRFESEEELDETIDYVFTLRMKPSKVRLRMLKTAIDPHQYLLVERR